MSFRIWVYFAMNKKLALLFCSLAILRSVLPVPPMRSTVNSGGRSPIPAGTQVGQISGNRLPMPPTQKNDNPSPRKVNFNGPEDPTPEIETIYLMPHKKTGKPPVLEPVEENNYLRQAHRTWEELQMFQPGKFYDELTDVEPISPNEAKTFKTSPELDVAKADFDRAQESQDKRRKRNKKLRQDARNRKVDEQILIGQQKDAETVLIQQKNRETQKLLKQMTDEQAEIDRQAVEKLQRQEFSERFNVEDDQQAERDKIFADFQAGLPKAPEQSDEERKFEQMKALNFSNQAKKNAITVTGQDSIPTESQSLSKPARLAPLTSNANPIPTLGRKLAPMSNLSPAFDLDAVARLKAAEKAMYEQEEARKAAAKAEQEAQSQMN